MGKTGWAQGQIRDAKGGNFALWGLDLFCPFQGGLRTYPQIIPKSPLFNDFRRVLDGFPASRDFASIA